MSITIETDRLVLELTTEDYMEKMIEEEPNEDMKQAYTEMLAGVKAHPDQREWNAVWLIKDKEQGTVLGDMCFKGISEDGVIEIGYGMKPEYEGKGYMTEAVIGITRWAYKKQEVKMIEAEADPDNFASHRVLEKAGFVKNGVMGVEGPRYNLVL